MWVRKQDKEALVNCNEFRIVEGACLLKGKYTIQSDGYILGIYESKEKALSVLDELQSWVNNLEYAKTTKSCRSIYVFNMPLDSEVN